MNACMICANAQRMANQVLNEDSPYGVRALPTDTYGVGAWEGAIPI